VRANSFIVRVALDQQDARPKVENFRPTPGMPADVYIETGQRTLLARCLPTSTCMYVGCSKLMT
jgi:hypothetical protein